MSDRYSRKRSRSDDERSSLSPVHQSRKRSASDAGPSSRCHPPASNAWANHFKLKFALDDMKIRQYDVDMEIESSSGDKKECPQWLRGQAMKKFCEKLCPERSPAFDGSKILYSNCLELFPEDPAKEKVTVTVDGAKFKVKVRVKKVLDTVKIRKVTKRADFGEREESVRPVMQALDVILRQACLRIDSLVSVDRCIFDVEDRRSICRTEARSFEVRSGAFQAVTLGESLRLNVNICCKAFPLHSMPVRDVYNNTRDDEEFLQIMKEVKVIYTSPINKRNAFVRITALAERPSRQTFMWNDKQVSVKEYMEKEAKGVRIDDQLPCLQAGRSGNASYFPMEFCELAPLKNQMPLRNQSKSVTEALVLASNSIRAANRKEMIETHVERKFGRFVDKEFGISVKGGMTLVAGKVLEMPSLTYSNVEKFSLQANGHWQGWDKRVFKKCREIRVKIVCIQDPQSRKNGRELLNFVKAGIEKNKNVLGVKSIVLSANHDLLDCINLKEELNGIDIKNADLSVVVLPNGLVQGENPYSIVKQVLERDRKHLTQCIKMQNALNPRAVYTLLVMKLNAKLGGTNYKLNTAFLEDKTRMMVMGADVTHPPAGSNTASIAAVTASYDPDMTKYTMQWRVQAPRVEIISDLRSITEQLAKFYLKKNKKQPRTVIYFRDGVSDSQFSEVLETEFKAIEKGCEDAGFGKVPITFIVVQKRHHTRFFRERGCNNVSPGFVVDNKITHPGQSDFFLVSHFCPENMGTARPTRYRVLKDEAKMEIGDIEKLAFYLCFLNVRCTKSVSLPAPTFYAHLAAARVKHFCDNLWIDPHQNKEENEAAWDEKIREVEDEVIARVDELAAEFPMFYL